MAKPEQCKVVELADLKWPGTIQIPSRRFRLFVAADSRSWSVDSISEFVSPALDKGMVYCCLWGPGCERFHDVVDEVIVKDDLGPRKFVGPNPKDTIMTTWHADESLDEALEFFLTTALPTEGFIDESDFRLVVCVGNPQWAASATRLIQTNLFSK